MRVHRTRLICIALLLGASAAGCNSLHSGEDGPRRWSADWYDAQANRADGARQIHSHGLNWPPYPRPCGEGEELTTRFHHAHYWPHPYNCYDRNYLRAVSAAQAASGWQKETTLYSYHFEEKDNTVNHAGKLRLRWILQTIPEQRRSVFVQASDDKAVSEARLANVRAAATELVGENALPPIILRTAIAEGRPTDEINQIRKMEKGGMRQPQIGYNSTGVTSSGVSGGGGNSGPP